MGVHKNIGKDKFPKQGDWLNREVSVCFNYDTSEMINGVIVRDDNESPFTTLIQLEDGRILNATECQYSTK
tara:strand:+ start:1741 stop:1953 length:213 start_codon:yes stop_codon:yes gene_type:complete